MSVGDVFTKQTSLQIEAIISEFCLYLTVAHIV